MNSTAVIAVVGILAASIVGPSLISVLTARQRRAERREDYARQDEVAKAAEEREARQEAAAKKVAAQAAEAAKLLLAEQKASIRRTDEVARLAAEAAQATAEKLEAIDTQGKTIHALVNQKLTDVTQQALTATLALLPHLEEAAARMRAGGVEPSEADMKRLDDTRRSIVDLKANLEQRAEKQAEVDAEAKIAGAQVKNS